MPIRKENRHHYQGETWRILREAILSRAENRCECTGECGNSHISKNISLGTSSNLCNRANGIVITGVKVVLTIAHLCHRPACKKPSHLKALCQGCHLRYDRFNRAHRNE